MQITDFEMVTDLESGRIILKSGRIIIRPYLFIGIIIRPDDIIYTICFQL